MINKKDFHTHCLGIIDKRIAELTNAIAQLNEDKSKETKSSAGDKYETGRAMLQQAEKQLSERLSIARNIKTTFNTLDPEKETTVISLGSLVTTNKGLFYLSASLGKVIYNKEDCFCLSALSPLGKLLMDKSAGEEVEFNGNVFKVKHFV